MRRRVAAVAFAMTLFMPNVLEGAYAAPPPPPNPPVCGYCSGPPKPPVAVPTLPPQVNPAVLVVAVHVSPRVRRGHDAKVTVSASSSDLVVAIIRYHSGKPVTYRGKVDSSGTYVKVWRLSRVAPLGKAQVHVDVVSKSDPYSATLSFTVTK